MRLTNEPLLFARFFPEVELFEDEEQRRAAILEAISHQKKSFVLETVLIGVSVSLFLHWFRGTVGTVSVLWQVLAGAGVLIAMVYVLAVLSLVVHAKKIRIALRSKLNEFGIPICMRCGYQLKGTPEPRCPECGTRVYRGLSEDVPWSDEEQKFFFGSRRK